MIDYITPIKSQLEKEMHIHCQVHEILGEPIESPIFYNYKGFDRDTKVLTIGSTQLDLSFEVQTDVSRIDVKQFWVAFREFRTIFLKEHYPLIKL